MHDVRARTLTAQDAVDGLKVLIKHGAGYVEGEMRNVKRKPQELRDTPSGPVLNTGEKVSYTVFSITGFETSGIFWPQWQYEPRMVNGFERPANISAPDPRRVLVADEDGPLIAEVADMVGASSRMLVHVPGLDADAAERRIVEILQAEGFEVWSAYTTADSEQRVDILDIGGAHDGSADEILASNILEAQSSAVATKGAYNVRYLPFDSERGFTPALSRS